MNVDQLEREASKLPGEQRAHLARRIIAGLDHGADIDRGWLREVRRQLRELEFAAVAAIPMEEAPTSAQQQARRARHHVRREALDEFIRAWKASRLDDRATSSNPRGRTWVHGVLRRLPFSS